MIAPIGMHNFHDVLAGVDFERRPKIRALLDAIQEFEAAADKPRAVAEIRAKYGIAQSTLYRRAARFRVEGISAIVPAGVRRKLQQRQTLPDAFVQGLWHILVESNQRKTAPAYRALFFDWLLPGKIIPGYGQDGNGTDWRGIYAQEHPAWPIPDVCPYRPHSHTPAGWSESNLRRCGPSAYGQAIARIGRLAASEFLPKVPSTRVGLKFGSAFVVDDVYHDAKVTFAGNREPQIVVELGALELLSGSYCSYGIKPVREKNDGGREVLREAFMRYLIADIVCRIGVSAEGCIIFGEHGTAHCPADLIATLDQWTGKKEFIRFEAGGLRHAPIAKGLYEGRPGGNFRFKAHLESHHNLKKNELAALPGQKGMDPDHCPEDLSEKEKYSKAIIAACTAVSRERPDLIEKVRTPFPHYYSYIEAVALLYARIDDRREHEIEGFDECGFTIEEFRFDPAQAWAPLRPMLESIPADQAALIQTLIQKDPRRYFNRRLMSPREARAFASALHPLIRLPEAAIPEILGPSLGHSVCVETDATFRIDDPYVSGKSYTVAAIVAGKHGDILLDRGSRWMVHLSPIDSRHAYVSHPDGRYIGKAPVMVPGAKTDLHALHRNLGIISRVETQELRRLAPLAEHRLRQIVEDRAHNTSLLTGRDPLAEDQAAQDTRLAADAMDLSPADRDAAIQPDAPPESAVTVPDNLPASHADEIIDLFRDR